MEFILTWLYSNQIKQHNLLVIFEASYHYATDHIFNNFLHALAEICKSHLQLPKFT